MEVLANGDLYLAGSFTGKDKTNAQYTNIVQYDSSIKQLRALTGGGLNGAINSIAATSTGITLLLYA